jgi:hypothetical protein
MSTMHRAGIGPSPIRDGTQSFGGGLMMRPETENHFLLVILLAGPMAVVVTPSAQVRRERRTLRAFGRCPPASCPQPNAWHRRAVPRAFYDLSYRQYKNLTSGLARHVARQLEVRIDPSDRMAYETCSVLSSGLRRRRR